MKEATTLIDGHYDPTQARHAVKMPIYMSSNYVFNSAEEARDLFQHKSEPTPSGDGATPTPSGFLYSRLGHPNLLFAENRLAAYEGAETALFFESGMAAISTMLMGLLSPGDTVLHSTPLYGGTDHLLRGMMQRWGVRLLEYWPEEPLEKLMERTGAGQGSHRIRLIYLETPANPSLETVDFARVMALKTKISEWRGAVPLTACDNTLLGPVFQKPLRHGIDIGIYSASKFLGGHSDLIAGALVCSHALAGVLRGVRSQLGGTASPHTAWLITRSMETLELRMEAAQRNSIRLVQFLSEHPLVEKLNYPGLLPPDLTHHRQTTGSGSLISFELKGGQAPAFCFLNALRLIRHAVSLGGTESMACHSATTTHSNVPAAVRHQYGIHDGLIRLSVGIEHVDDLLDDLHQALHRAGSLLA